MFERWEWITGEWNFGMVVTRVEMMGFGAVLSVDLSKRDDGKKRDNEAMKLDGRNQNF